MRNTYIGVLAIIEMIKTLSALAWARVGALFLTLQSLGERGNFSKCRGGAGLYYEHYDVPI